AAGRPSPERLREAIIAVAGTARPRVGRSSLDAILRGARRARDRYERLEGFGVAGGLTQAETLAAIDSVVAAGELVSSGGRYPTLSPGRGRVPDPAVGRG